MRIKVKVLRDILLDKIIGKPWVFFPVFLHPYTSQISTKPRTWGDFRRCDQKL